MPPKSWKIIGSLRTAVAAKQPAWLEANAELIQRQHDDKELSDEQFEEFQSILTQAPPAIGKPPRRK